MNYLAKTFVHCLCQEPMGSCLCTDCSMYSDTHIHTYIHTYTHTYTHTHTHTYTHLHLLIIVSEVCLFVFPFCSVSVILLESNKSRPSDGKGAHVFLFPSPPSKYMHMSCSLIACVSFLPLVQSLPVQLFSSLPIDGKKDPQYSIQSECESLQLEEKVRLHTCTHSNSQSDR